MGNVFSMHSERAESMSGVYLPSIRFFGMRSR